MLISYDKWKINLLNLNVLSLMKLIRYIKISNYYLDKILYCLYKKNITNINNIKTDGKNSIELVAIPNSKNHYTLCLSSQLGCALQCSFCYTGTQGFKRNLMPYEIINQVLQAVKRIMFIFKTKKITNIVFIGMGEPLLNIKNLLVSINVITNKYTYNINVNKITISTSGIIPGIKILVSHNIPLALSLHAAKDELRTQLMPINKKYSIVKLLEEYKKIACNNKLTIEYVMLKNVND